MMTNKKDEIGLCLYLIVPCYNEEEVIRVTASRMKDKMLQLMHNGIINKKSRVVFVNDGSLDSTRSILHELHNDDESFSVLNFSRNFGHQNAVMAGYLFALDKCDVAISIDADLQQDINAIDEFLERYNDGFDVVYGVRNSRNTDTFFKKSTSQLFYGLMRFLGANTIPNHADYRLLSNRVLNTLAQYNESNLFLRGLIPELGYNSCIVYFDVHERLAGKSKYSLIKMLRLALDGVTSHSLKPMHIISSLGGIAVVLAVINMIYTVVVHFMGLTVSGWSTIVISIWFIGGIQLISLGCVGEYVGKCYLESKKRPRYIVESVEHE